eukprot:m.333917 g.333917  ORF g.333917 m.333917 type:complete len:246 (+) comp20505_c0_seq16:790-1527(+)
MFDRPLYAVPLGKGGVIGAVYMVLQRVRRKQVAMVSHVGDDVDGDDARVGRAALPGASTYKTAKQELALFNKGALSVRGTDPPPLPAETKTRTENPPPPGGRRAREVVERQVEPGAAHRRVGHAEPDVGVPRSTGVSAGGTKPSPTPLSYGNPKPSSRCRITRPRRSRRTTWCGTAGDESVRSSRPSMSIPRMPRISRTRITPWCTRDPSAPSTRFRGFTRSPILVRMMMPRTATKRWRTSTRKS